MACPNVLRQLRGVLAALLVLAFTAGPGIEGLICVGDVAVAAEAHVDHPPEGHDHEGEAPCHHGHCHHGGGFTAVEGGGAPLPMERRCDHGPARAGPGVSDMQFGLMRPPRD